MLKRCYLLILMVIFLTACAHHQKTPREEVQGVGSSIKEFRRITSFTEVDVQGKINITLHTGYKKPEVILRGDPRDLAQIKTTVSSSTLFIVLGKGYPRYGAVHADIRGQSLDRVRYVGAGVISGTQLNTRFLDLYIQNPGITNLGGHVGIQNLDLLGDGQTRINGLYSNNLQIRLKGNPKVQLSGFATLAKLDVDGKAWISLYWIKSYHLVVVAKKAAKIQLAGIVNRLEVELWGSSQFKGRYLRAQRSFVRTHDHSKAEISAVNHQSNLATDASDIYYYNLPYTRADFMAYNGSVLDMREWNRPNLKDFTLYNKQFP